MLFGEIDLPEDVLIAQSEGKLVLFVGAGASRGAPSSLPDFEGLAAAIARRALTELERSRLDHFLGDLEDQKIDVHQRAYEALTANPSSPAPLHEALAKLFLRPEHVRIVSTNFDAHLVTAVANQNYDIPIYTAPALPRGHNFNGVVFLHGALTGPRKDLVLTDRDFGRAYLTEGWARSFVEGLFAGYTILFVGYSHRDPPMHYIARGLPSRGRRFALTEEESKRWDRLGVEAVKFPLAANEPQFQPLTAGVQRWAEVTNSSSFIIEQQIIQILAQPDPNAISTSDTALLLWSLRQDHTTGFFTANASSIHWVEWLSKKGLLASYFDPRYQHTEPRERNVGVWLAEKLILGPLPRALELVRENGGRFSPALVRSLVSELYGEEGPKEWVALLAQEVDDVDHHTHLFLGSKLRKLSQSRSPAFFPLFQALTTPRLGIETDSIFTSTNEAHLTFEIAGLADEVWSAWAEGIRPRLPDIGRVILDLLMAQLQRLTQLANATSNTEAYYRRINYWIPRIGPKVISRHHHGHQAYVLADMLVDTIRHLARRDDGLSDAEISRWLGSDDRLLRRLGVVAVFESTTLSSDQKAGILRPHIEAWQIRSQERLDAEFVIQSLTTPAPEEKPSTTPVQSPQPTAAWSMDEILRHSSREIFDHFGEIRLQPASALALIEELTEKTRRDPSLERHSAWDLLLQRAPWPELDSSGRERLLIIVEAPFVAREHTDATARSLFEHDPLAGDKTPKPGSDQVQRLFALSRSVWAVMSATNDAERPDLVEANWSSLQLNHPIHRIVLFWLRYLSLEAISDPPALPPSIAEIFSQICALRTDTARRARAFLAQELPFLMARDPRWVKDQLLPQFDFEHQGDEAWVVWQPLLEHGKLSRQVANEMLPRYRSAQNTLLADSRDEITNGYLKDAAAIMVHVVNPLGTGWLRALLPALSDESRARWARLVDNELDGVPADRQVILWNDWLRAYWSERATGSVGDAPLPLSGREVSVMARWTLALTAVFTEALRVLQACPAPNFDEEFFAWREISQSKQLATERPLELVEFVEYLLRHMGRNHVHHESIVEVAGSLPRIPGLRPRLLAIAEQMLQSGWTGSANFRDWVLSEFPA